MAAKPHLTAFPPMAKFPTTAWREHLLPEEWEACLDAWIALADAHLSLSSPDFVRISIKDESLAAFLTSYAAESSQSSLQESSKLKSLRKKSYMLCFRLLDCSKIAEELLHWSLLVDVSKVYGVSNGGKLVAIAWQRHATSLEASLGSLKNSLIKNLDAGLKGDLKSAEAQLKRLNHLLHVSPDAAAFFVAGSDFLDSLISCFKLMNPPLRKTIISTTYLSLIGLTEGDKPQFSSLIDQLYSLKSAADAHKAGPTNEKDSLVANLVSQTPILKQVQQKLRESEESGRAKPVLSSLEAFKIAGVSGKPHKPLQRKVNKGKSRATDEELGFEAHGQIHIHRMSLITQIQDLFPDLGSGFIVKLLDEYNENVEQVISQLLEGSLPEHLESADRSEQLEPSEQMSKDPAPALDFHPTQSSTPARRNVFDDDEFDRLAISTSRLHIGQRNPNQTADAVLRDRSNAPSKAAILSALAAFDSDDDERDDTYDIEDVGGTVDTATNDEAISDTHDEPLFRAYKLTPEVFARDAATRRGKARIALREETGMTDEAVEGWALMLSRDARRMRRLEAKFSTFQGAQRELAPTAWKASPAGSGAEDSSDGNHMNDRGRGGRLRGAGRGRGRGRGDVAGPTGEKETEAARNRKAANKGSTANHNRRDQRAKKMARGGFPG